MMNVTQWNYLIKCYQASKLPHALLFTGNKGLGKQALAIKFTEYLFCLHKAEAACGECRNCKLIQANTLPDFYHLQPEEEGKLIRIDQIRELITQLEQTAQQNTYKVAIIEPANALNIAASNALLKTLEEPRPNTLIILITEQATLLPATIRSRCQLIKFVTNNQVLIYNDHFEERKKLLADLKKIILSNDDPIRIAANWTKANIIQLIDWLAAIVIDAINLSFFNDTKNIMHNDLLDDLQIIVQGVNAAYLFACLDKLYLVKKQLLASNLNQQLLLESMFISWNKKDSN